MCELCFTSPCRSGCPNGALPNSIGTCEACGAHIYIGDRYADVNGFLYHDHCLSDFGTEEWLDLLGSYIQEAEEA